MSFEHEDREFYEKTDKNPEEERIEVLHLLHKLDKWDERLLSSDLFGDVENLLSPREFFVLEELVKGTSNVDLIKLLRRSSPSHTFSEYSLGAMKSSIKRKLRDRFDRELPGWVRNKIWVREDDMEDTNLWE